MPPPREEIHSPSSSSINRSRRSADAGRSYPAGVVLVVDKEPKKKDDGPQLQKEDGRPSPENKPPSWLHHHPREKSPERRRKELHAPMKKNCKVQWDSSTLPSTFDNSSSPSWWWIVSRRVYSTLFPFSLVYFLLYATQWYTHFCYAWLWSKNDTLLQYKDR